MILLSIVVVLIALYALFGGREHLSVNKDTSKNWDKPELSSLPAYTPEYKDLKRVEARLAALETSVSNLKTKVH